MQNQNQIQNQNLIQPQADPSNEADEIIDVGERNSPKYPEYPEYQQVGRREAEAVATASSSGRALTSFSVGRDFESCCISGWLRFPYWAKLRSYTITL